MKKHAKNSTHPKNMHVSICLHGNNVVSIAANKDHKHSEVRAIRKANGAKVDTIINLRIKRKSGKIGLAFPCNDCYNTITSSNIEKVIYTTDEGTFREFDLSMMR